LSIHTSLFTPQLEREEFFRLKRSQDKKKRNIAIKEEAAALLKAEEAADAADALGAGADPDVIY